jgi:hypothetical protein
MTFSVKRDDTYAESNVTIIGVTKHYGRPQFVLVNSDEGKNSKLKFPGLRFRLQHSENATLEDMAKARFEEQTGLSIKMLGLRNIIPTRSRHNDRWIFRNVFLGALEDYHPKIEHGREVYLADLGQGTKPREERVKRFGDTKTTAPLDWVVGDNMIVARVANSLLSNFNWDSLSTNYYSQIPCLTPSMPGSELDSLNTELGCALAVSSMFLFYQEKPSEPQKVILIQRRGDKYPGYGGGKIETLNSSDSENIDPISCCAQEGSEEFGFEVQPRALVGVAVTPVNYPKGQETSHYNSIINYSFMAYPTNPLKVAEALRDPRSFLEGKMERYVVETLDEHRDRVSNGELRMPDMIPIGKQLYRTPPGQKINLTHIRASGNF